MKFGTLPEVVIYTEFGVQHKALPIGARELEHHTGSNGELLLNLVIVKPLVADSCANCGNRRVFHGKPAPAHLRVCAEFVEPDPQTSVDPASLVHIVTDVAHESHVFTDEQIKELAAKGLSAYPGGQFPGGRWSEIDPIVVDVSAPAETPDVAPEPPASQEPPPVVN
jgi:hypothetical protein